MISNPTCGTELPVAALYRDDGIDYLAKQPSEVLTSLILLPRPFSIGSETAVWRSIIFSTSFHNLMNKMFNYCPRSCAVFSRQ